MVKVFVDTDILIDFTYKKNKILYKLIEEQKKGKAELFINPVVCAEFLTDKKLLDPQKLEEACGFLDSFHMVEITVKIGFLAGQLLRERKMPFLVDALIAATCLVHNLSLATRNNKHFAKVPEHSIYSTV